MTIGVLDDDPAICRFLEAALGIAGYKVYAYTNPSEFVSSVYPDKIDYFHCIIVDFHLPGGRSGAEIIRQVRMDYAYLPAILISAEPLSQKAAEGLADIVIFQKPFRLSKLLGVIKIFQEA